MRDWAIRIERISKQYRIGQGRPRYHTLRDAVSDLVKAPLRRLSALSGHAEKSDLSHLWALHDVSAEIGRGEVVGIVGANGAGKSTLLKILARITEPTSGHADVRGRLGALLEVGTGFHPELTGRENIYLNSAIIGMRRATVERKFDQIVAFAEVEKFIETPVKFYSTGMYLRLAFAVAAHLEPDILLVDEVMAVGDAAFQRKCLGKMGEVAKGGRTVLVVSHNLAMITRLCSRVLVLSKGMVKTCTTPEDAVAAYLSDMPQGSGADLLSRVERSGSGRMRFTSIAMQNGHRDSEILHSGAAATFHLGYASPAGELLRNVLVEIKITDAFGGILVTLSTALAGKSFAELPPEGTIDCHIPSLCLAASPYHVTIQCFVNGELADLVTNAAPLTVAETDFFGSGKVAKPRVHGHFLVNHAWSSS
jgi:lipopolysaccharide transport system ATP-binding protein